MGKLMLALVITILLCESFTQNVSKDKGKDKKSVEFVMVSQASTSGNTNKRDVSTLIVNTTYDDSVHISTFNQGVNVTFFQEHNSIVDVADGKNVVNTEISDELEPIDILNNEVNELVENKNVSSRKANRRVIHLQIKIGSLLQKTENKSIIKRLQGMAEKLMLFKSKLEHQDEINDKKLIRLLKILKARLKATELRKEDVKSLDRKSNLAKELTMRSQNKRLRKTALIIIKKVEAYLSPYKFNLKRLVQVIRQALRSKYYTPRNASVFKIFIAQLNEIVPTLKANSGRNLVKSVKQEIGNLAEEISTIATIQEILKLEVNEFKSLKNVPNLQKILMNVIKNSKNVHTVNKAKELLIDFNEKLRDIPIADEIEKSNSPDSTNQIINHLHGDGSAASLKFTVGDLINMSSSNTSSQIAANVESLLDLITDYKKCINDVLGFLENVKNGIKIPKKVEGLEKKTEKNESFDNPSATQVKTQDFTSKMKTSGADGDFNNISFDTASLIKPLAIKNSLPSVNSIAKLEMKKEAETLLMIVNGYIKDVLPLMDQKVKSVNESYSKLKEYNLSNPDIDALSDQIFIVSNNLSRSMKGLKSVKTILLNTTLKSFDKEASISFITERDTMKELFKLNNLHRDPTAHAMLKKTFTITQNVKHANDTLKQLQQMISFNIKLLNLNTTNKATPLLKKLIKTEIVPIKKASLFLPVNGTDEKPGKIKAATEATDLDKLEFTVSSTNRKGAKVSADTMAI